MNEIPKILKLKRNGEFYDYIESLCNKDPYFNNMSEEEISYEYEQALKDEAIAFNIDLASMVM